MLFADAEGFWRAPSVYDVIGIAGFLIGIVSIWLAWWLARRDIQRRLTDAANQASKAARDEVRRVAQALIQTGLSVTIRSLELAREACHGKRWPRATELCILAREQLARVLAQPAADETLQSELREVTATLQECTRSLRGQPKVGTGGTPHEVLNGFDESILALHRVESKITGVRPEADHGQ